MIDKPFIIFLQLANLHTLQQVSDAMYISRPAILAHINSMEDEYKLKLFDRTKKGFFLTDNGKIFYKAIKNAQKEFTSQIDLIYKTLDIKPVTLTIGISFLDSAKEFLDFWNRIQNQIQFITLNIAFYDDSNLNFKKSIIDINNGYDFFCSIYDDDFKKSNYNFLLLRNATYCIAVKEGSPFFHKSVINIDELSNVEVIVPSETVSNTINNLKNDFLSKNPYIKFVTTNSKYSIETFNNLLTPKNALIIPDCWVNVHPNINVIRINYSKTIPFGILYSKKPSNNCLYFINLLKQFLHK